ncbi:hypothetical protein PYW08_013123 [Mythimna loreyi]|uniref:Uncharacterized protein n=1 Tax=Mythimna loreyi TaxID=667449 RepID=A0ACC2QEP6_9NEOP|nr:hypothetical protein PYW08_013123 [Mythimna loreyi]
MLLVRLAQLALLHGVVCLDAHLEGDLALDLQVASRPRGKGRWHRVAWEAGSRDVHELVFRMSEQQSKVTVATELQCIYQFPEQAHVNALLSNMMNQLAKVFVQANEYMECLETRCSENEPMQASQKDYTDVTVGMRGTDETELVRELEKEPVTEKLKEKITRFKVVHEKQKPFFDIIYSNMTNEFRNLYNTTFERVERASQAPQPCSRQDEVKQLWRELLTHAHDTLQRAAQRFLAHYVADTPAHNQSKMRKRLEKILKTELSKIRANHLDMLCDTYQLCYSDLLEFNNNIPT